MPKRKKLGRPKGSKNFNEPSQTFVMQIPLPLHRSLRECAKIAGISMGEIVRNLLANFINCQ